MGGKFESVEACLEKNVPEDELKELKRVLYGKACRLGPDVYTYVPLCTRKMHGGMLIQWFKYHTIEY